MNPSSTSGLVLSPEKRRLLDQLLKARGIVRPDPGPIPRRETGDEAPLSLAQQRLSFLHRLDPTSPFYNVAGAMQLGGRLDVAALSRALDALVERHEAMRTVFVDAEPEMRQRILPPFALALPIDDLSAWPPDCRDAEARARVDAWARQPFDLTRGPLVRAWLLRLDDERHLLALALHHIVCDGWSIAQLVSDLAAAYAGVPLPPLAVQYADFAVWQRRSLQGPHVERLIEFWRERLLPLPPSLELPADRPRRAAQSFRGRTLTRVVPDALLARARTMGAGGPATLFHVLLAAFAALVARYTGETDLCIGTLVANRSRPELEPLVGFFVNTLALRIDAAGDPTAADLLDRVRDASLSAFAYQELPFERLIEELQPRRSLAAQPLFNVMFIHQGASADGRVRLGDLDARRVHVETGASRFDLTFSVEALNGQTVVQVEYSTELFDDDRIERMLDHWFTLIGGAATDVELRLSALPLLRPAERHTVLDTFNATDVRWTEDGVRLHELVERQARATPDAVAVSFEGATLTYRALDAQANRIARRLQAWGAGPETLVAVLAERCLGLVPALLGVLKAGAAYLPIDPGIPDDRLAWMLADARPVAVLSPRSHVERFGAIAIPLLVFDDPRIAAEPSQRLDDVPGTPGTLAYAIYTSGSTGRPKCAANTHDAVVNRLHWMQQQFELGPGEAVLQKTTCSFDVSVWEIFWPLTAGARVVLARPDGHRDPRYLAETITREQITTIHFVPPMLRVFLEEERSGVCRSLRRIVCSGEALSPDLARACQTRLRAAELHNLYGPTEAAIDVTHWPCRVDRDGDVVPIGRPIANTRIYILDRHLQPAPIGVPGELYIGGRQVGRGYLARPALTAERFVPDPFGPVPGARLYRTGDIARYRVDGAIEFLGRADDQLKVRGFRIEPGEIETVIGRVPGVAHAAVLARDDVPGDRRLVAYVVPAGTDAGPVEAPPPAPRGASPRRTRDEALAGAIREALPRVLPEYMVPSAIAFVDRLPLTPNGKIDRPRLVAPSDVAGAGGRFVPPRTAAEEAVAAIWREVLQIEQVGIRDDFFALGGHSLMAARVAARVRAVFGIDLPVRAMFETPTIETLTPIVMRACHPTAPATTDPIRRRSPDGPVPLAFAQERLWFLDRLAPGSAAYAMPAAIRLRGPLDVARLQRALEAVVHRHGILRTTFPLVDGRPVQVVAPEGPLDVPLVDLSAMREPEAERAVRRLAAEQEREPFALAAGPLVRARLVRLADAHHILLFATHHIVADGWSLALLTREIGELYAALVEDRPSPLAPLPFQYADFAVWQRARAERPEHAGQLQYWTEQLAGRLPLLDLPADRPRPSVLTFRGGMRTTVLDRDLSEALGAFSRRAQVTLFMTLLAAFATLLFRYTGQTDVAIGSGVANRGRRELEPLIGCFINVLVLRTDLSGQPSFRELLRRVRDVTLNAYANQDVPFERIVDALQPDRDLARQPLFQVMLVVHNEPASELRLGSLEVSPVEIPRSSAQFDLTLHVRERRDGLTLALEYSADLFDASTADRMLEHLGVLLAAAIEEPERAVADLPILGPAERQLVARAWNATRAPYPDRACLHEIVEAHVDSDPAAAAIVGGGAPMTLGDLEARANQLAHALRQCGVGPDTCVGVGLERSPDLIVATLAVLKAGGAFVPLDARYPAERLTHMVRDAGVSTVIARGIIAESPALHGVRILGIDSPAVRLESTERPAPVATPEHLAYVIYTSGSTGTPKGVAVRHRGALNNVADLNRRFEIGAADSVLSLSSPSFDMSVYEHLGLLAAGGRVIVPEPGGERDPACWAALIAEHQVTVWNSAPALLEMLVGFAAGRPDVDLHSLRVALLGGDRIAVTLPGRLRSLAPRVRVIGLGGATEASIHSTVFPVDAVDPAWTRIPYGRAMANQTTYVLDSRLQPVPIGVRGELFLGGLGLARGYLRRPDLTAERFLPNPLSDEPGARMYRTGDLVRFLPNGTLDLLGRVDDQVKIRGHRVEPGEIAAVLREHPEVADAAAAAHRDRDGDVRLCAYVRWTSDASPGVDRLMMYLTHRLPPYMTPAAIVTLDRLPLSPNGKLDRRALPRPDFDRLASDAPFVAPRTPTEERLAKLWRDLLGLERVGTRDNFFAQGGHSLLAVRLAAGVRDRFGVDLSLRAIFEDPTPAAVAVRIDEARTTQASPITPIPRARREQFRADGQPRTRPR